MNIRLTMIGALEIAERAYGGLSDVLTVTRRAGEDVSLLAWWQSDHGEKMDRGWRGRRDCGALYAYCELSRHAAPTPPANEFPTEFYLSDGAWCRPDKEIIKQGLRRRYLGAVLDREKVTGFHITDDGLRLVRQFFPNIAAD
jgi:hypothetical protein